MGLQQSKDELLYQQVNYGNIEGIKGLRQQGAGLEWIDKEGKTPLIAACLRHDLLPVAKALIEMGANVNAYRPGNHAGTPLHHAAKKGLEQTVNLLLSSGANPFIKNDDCHTALDLAREKGHCNVVRAIESRISLFAGWLREHYGPSFLEAFAPQLLTRKVWVVVLSCDYRNSTRPAKFELAIYSDLQMSKPRNVISLWKARIEEPKLNQTDPAVFIVDKAARARYKLLSANEGDKRQLQWFYNACLGFPQSGSSIPASAGGAAVTNPSQVISNGSTTSPAVSATIPEDVQLAMAINASIQTALAEGVPGVLPSEQSDSTSGWGNTSDNSTYNGWSPSNPRSSNKVRNQAPAPAVNTYNGWAAPDVMPDANPQQSIIQTSSTSVVSSSQQLSPTLLPPSAPPVTDDFFHGPINYPSIDSSPINLSMPVAGTAPVTTQGKGGANMFEVSKPGSSGEKEGTSNMTCCAICLDAPVEGACIPCGHMAGCMSCLREIEAKSRECPVCRTKLDKVIRLYAV